MSTVLVKCKAVSLDEWTLKATNRGEIGRILRTATGRFLPVLVDGTEFGPFSSLRAACTEVSRHWWHREARYAFHLKLTGKGVETPSITCPRCGMRSYHPEDISRRFCGACNQFHEG